MVLNVFFTKNNISGAISFSSSLMTLTMIHTRYVNVGGSFNIITRIKEIGKETCKLIEKMTGSEYCRDF